MIAVEISSKISMTDTYVYVQGAHKITGCV